MFHPVPAARSFAVGGELYFHFDALEAAIVTYQSFTDKIAVPSSLRPEIVVQVHAPCDDLTAAIAFYVEYIVSFFRFGGPTAEEIFEEAHGMPFMSLRASRFAVSEAISSFN